MSLVKITLNDREIVCQEGDSLLDALLREHVTISHGCRNGVCHSCMVRSLQGVPPAAAQSGLKDALLHQNHFLACLCYPEQPMVISLSPPAEFFTEAIVTGKRIINAETLWLTLECVDSLGYYAGQFVNLTRADGLKRTYTVAQTRSDTQKIGFHIHRLAAGRFSDWPHQELNVGDYVSISDPQGLCCYLPTTLDRNMLLIGTGAGLTPLAAIIRDALCHAHRGEIHLFHGSREMDGLYWIDEMRELMREYRNFHYTPCVSRGDAPHGVFKGRADDAAMSSLRNLKDWRVYLSGHPEMVNHAKRLVYFKGAVHNDINADAYHVASSTLD